MASLLPEFSKPQDFEYDALDSETRIVVRQRTSELKHLMRRTAQDIVEIGQKLIEVRKQLGYGNFRKWLKAEFDWSHTAATKFIQVAQEFGCINFMQVDIAASALYLLAAPSTPEEARQEALERAFQGESITHALAKQIRFHHTIDVEAETVANDEETPDLNQAPPEQEPLPHPETANKPLPLTNEAKIETRAIPDTDRQPTPEASPASKKLEDSAQTELAPITEFQVGDRVRILRCQHGEDNWAGETARIWQITSDGWLRVDIEGHEGVRFTLNPDWVEPMEEETPEQQDDQPEQVLDEGWTDEPDPAPPVIAEAPYEAQHQGKTLPQFQAGDRLQVTNLGKSNQQWMGEVAEVVEAAEGCIKVVLEIQPAV